MHLSWLFSTLILVAATSSTFKYVASFSSVSVVRSSRFFALQQSTTATTASSNDRSSDEKPPIKSAAVEWAKKEGLTGDVGEAVGEAVGSVGEKKFVIIGGGWAGWGSAKALCESEVNAEVILIDALPDPTGLTPYVSKTGKPVEAGTRGFWYDYPNINALCEELGLSEDDIFTPFTNSSFYSPDGLEATAPVFSEAKLPELFGNVPFLKQFSDEPFPTLPSPLGQIVATFPLFERIPLADRASMAGLLYATIDCLGSDESVQMKYDRMTAHDLFIQFKLSSRLVEDFIKPTLLVGLFKPPEELSALVVMELLYYYALAHQNSFDVRWIKNGTVSDSLVAPLAVSLQEKYDLKVMGGCRVGKISLEPDTNDGNNMKARTIEYQNSKGETSEISDIDGIVLALGCKGMESVVRASPDLAKLSTFSSAASLKGIDVISARIWFDKKVATRTPANVFSRFDSLRGAGGTFFMLDQLQENNPLLWGENEQSEDKNDETRGSVVACDFYNAGSLISLADEDIIRTLTEDLLPSAVPQFADATVVDSWVGKYPGTVSWFSPGSYSKRPPLEGAGKTLPNVKCAGDWVRMGEKEHGAKGLCQERAFVSGFEAANSILREVAGDDYKPHKVLPVREDESQFKVGVAINNQIMKVLPRFWVR